MISLAIGVIAGILCVVDLVMDRRPLTTIAGLLLALALIVGHYGG